MRLPSYIYTISDEKYAARIDLFKYLIGIYTALIVASLIGFEKAQEIVSGAAVTHQALEYLRISVLALVFAIVQSIILLAITYHHKYYNRVFLKQHHEKHSRMKLGWMRTIFGWYVWLEHVWAVIETGAVIFLAGTWFILPIMALCYLAKAYQGVLP